MTKTHSNFRLSLEALRQLEYLSQLTGRSSAVLIEFAVENYYKQVLADQGRVSDKIPPDVSTVEGVQVPKPAENPSTVIQGSSRGNSGGRHRHAKKR